MFGNLFEKKEVGNEAAPASAPIALAGDYDMGVSFEDGAMILTGPGFRFRLDKASALTLANKAAVAQRFTEIESPAHGPFGNAELKKVCEIARLLSHGLDMSQIGRIYGEKAASVREFYSYGLGQSLFRESSAADGEKTRLSELDRVRSTRGFEGGVINVGGRLVSQVTGVPIPEQFTRLNALEVSTALRAAGGNAKAAAAALKVDAGDLEKWLQNNSELMAVL